MSDEQEAALDAAADATAVTNEAPAEATSEPQEAQEAEAEAQEAEAEAQTEETTEADESKVEEPEQPKKTPWFQRRIDDLTREKYEARREAEALRAALEAQQSGEAAPEKPVTRADIEKEAARLVQEQEFNKACNSTYEAGTKQFKDFTDALSTLNMVSGGLPREFVEAALEADNPHEVLYRLGKDPEEAARILSLHPARMGAAIVKFSAKAPPAPPPVSKAPPPIRPVGGSARVESDPERMSMDEWEKKFPLPARR